MISKCVSCSAICLLLTAAPGCDKDGGQGDEGQPCYPNGTCNAGLECVDGICVSESGDAATDPDTGDIVQDDQVSGHCTNDDDCSNGLVCDGVESCVDGECRPGTALDCEDWDPCTMDSCDEDEGGCVNSALDFDGDGYIAQEAPDGTPCGGTDCNDLDESVFPDSSRRDCTGDGDLNCNGTVDRDDNYRRAMDECRIGWATDNAKNPSLVWTGSELGVSWDDLSSVFFARVSIDGIKIGSHTLIAENEYNTESCLAWTGSEFGLLWCSCLSSGGCEVLFNRISTEGTRLDEPLKVNEGGNVALWVSMAWTGSNFGMAWADSIDETMDIYFTLVTESGEKAASDVKVNDTVSFHCSPSLVWTGTEFGISWNDVIQETLLFNRISADGVTMGGNMIISSAGADPSSPSMVWTGSCFGIAWYDSRHLDDGGNTEVYFTLLTPDGLTAGPETRITDAAGESDYPDLTWTGTDFGMAWEDSRGEETSIYFIRMNAEGARIGDDIFVAGMPSSAMAPSLCWTGSDFGLTWYNWLDIYFTRMGCYDL